jgi:TnpA family transposase
MNISKGKVVIIMSKTEFLMRWYDDRDFRFRMKKRGIRVIQNNVIFFNSDGTVKAVAGTYVL